MVESTQEVVEQQPQSRQEEVEKAKKLAGNFTDFCLPAGDRLFSGYFTCFDKQGNKVDSIYEETEEHEDGMTIRSSKLIYDPANDPELVRVYNDDKHYKELLAHTAFKEKINGANTFIDIGNGGNDALRVDADFLKRNGFGGKVIGVDPFRNVNEINTKNDLHTEAIKQDGLSYLLEMPDGESNIFCSNLDDSIIQKSSYARALVKEIFRVTPNGGLFICIDSQALEYIAEEIFPHSYKLPTRTDTTIFTKTPISEKTEVSEEK